MSVAKVTKTTTTRRENGERSPTGTAVVDTRSAAAAVSADDVTVVSATSERAELREA